MLMQLQLAAEAIDVCSEAHQRDPRNANVLRDRAEAYILNQDYEKGRETESDKSGFCQQDSNLKKHTQIIVNKAD